ncbi:hypothetical protein NHH03_06345 [Stieleria sp. TO1_6]|uniref:hypothetical protein n=1 Tax=Stieleria tagensis TaxID=2956795 RepID=UPI00209A90BF|nr:hypothetical protein [Stieleria tagensis]MCO8121350.1 hypothetical protein [Stieleria tagensis]
MFRNSYVGKVKEMKYWMMLFCLVVAGCGSSEPSNIVGNADQEAIDAYEAALAEADKMQAADTDFKD